MHIVKKINVFTLYCTLYFINAIKVKVRLWSKSLLNLTNSITRFKNYPERVQHMSLTFSKFKNHHLCGRFHGQYNYLQYCRLWFCFNLRCALTGTRNISNLDIKQRHGPTRKQAFYQLVNKNNWLVKLFGYVLKLLICEFDTVVDTKVTIGYFQWSYCSLIFNFGC